MVDFRHADNPVPFSKANELSEKEVATKFASEVVMLTSENTRLSRQLEEAVSFIEEITLANGKYPGMNGTPVVAGAYAALKLIRDIGEGTV